MYDKGEFLDKLQIDGVLVPRRCTEQYLTKHNLNSALDSFVSEDFGTISERIKFVRYGGGYCLVCGTRTKISKTNGGFNSHCVEHFHEPKKGKVAHNKKEMPTREELVELYVNQKLPLLTIATTLGNVSNVTVKKWLDSYSIPMRSHSETISLVVNRGYTKPMVIIDREELVSLYNEKTPVSILAEMYSCDQETIRRFLKQEGVELTHRRSAIEWMVASILNANNIRYKQNDRKLLVDDTKVREMDFYLEDYKLGLELNGIYYHTVRSGNKTPKYHKEKYDMANEVGIKLLQFWEPDILAKLDIVESMILNSCGLTKFKYHARKTIIQKVDFATIRDFCIANHIQGAPAKNTQGYGLFDNGELICLLGYQETKEAIVINRFCSKLNSVVRGGFSKLLKPLSGKIITHSSNDISNGAMYKMNGFECISEQRDMYYTDYTNILNRQGFMKSKLKDKLAIFDETKTEIDNMFINGYDVIYKSGTKTWVLTK